MIQNQVIPALLLQVETMPLRVAIVAAQANQAVTPVVAEKRNPL
jgi:hypothetical protein